MEGVILVFVGVFLAVLVVGIVATVVLARQAARRRAEALAAAAARLDWAFRAEVPIETVFNLERFELFATGRNRKLSNLLTSPAGELRAVVFDYSYVTHTGKSTHTHRQTVFYAVGDRLDLPTFSLRPENFMDRVAAMIGYQDIDVAGRPEFSQLFLLRGEDESAVRAAFSDAVAGFFERHPGMCAAAIGHELLYWRPRRLAKPEEIGTLIEEGFELARVFSGSVRA